MGNSISSNKSINKYVQSLPASDRTGYAVALFCEEAIRSNSAYSIAINIYQPMARDLLEGDYAEMRAAQGWAKRVCDDGEARGRAAGLAYLVDDDVVVPKEAKAVNVKIAEDTQLAYLGERATGTATEHEGNQVASCVWKMVAAVAVALISWEVIMDKIFLGADGMKIYDFGVAVAVV
jgi:hypothetical protein